jgi:hypothetical protein
MWVTCHVGHVSCGSRIMWVTCHVGHVSCGSHTVPPFCRAAVCIQVRLRYEYYEYEWILYLYCTNTVYGHTPWTRTAPTAAGAAPPSASRSVYATNTTNTNGFCTYTARILYMVIHRGQGPPQRRLVPRRRLHPGPYTLRMDTVLILYLYCTYTVTVTVLILYLYRYCIWSHTVDKDRTHTL